jgi:hypothetical protein
MTNPRMIGLWIVLVALLVAGGGPAFAQSGSGAATDTAPRTTPDPVPPVTPPATPPGASPTTPPPPVPPPATTPPAGGGSARDACVAAMNADPKFAESIVKTADEQAALERDKATVAAHKDANFKVQRNERHVIYGYAAMWVIAAGFVIFLWRRQQALKLEIVALRRDLEAAADTPASKGRT